MTQKRLSRSYLSQLDIIQFLRDESVVSMISKFLFSPTSRFFWLVQKNLYHRTLTISHRCSNSALNVQGASPGATVKHKKCMNNALKCLDEFKANQQRNEKSRSLTSLSQSAVFILIKYSIRSSSSVSWRIERDTVVQIQVGRQK